MQKMNFVILTIVVLIVGIGFAAKAYRLAQNSPNEYAQLRADPFDAIVCLDMGNDGAIPRGLLGINHWNKVNDRLDLQLVPHSDNNGLFCAAVGDGTMGPGFRDVSFSGLRGARRLIICDELPESQLLENNNCSWLPIGDGIIGTMLQLRPLPKQGMVDVPAITIGQKP